MFKNKRSSYFSLPLAFISIISVLPFQSAMSWAADREATSITTSATEVKATTLRKEEFSVRPEIGIMSYQNDLSQGKDTGIFGLMFDINAVNALDMAGMRGSNWYLGLASVITYSRVGTFGSSFLSVPVNL